MMKATKAKIIAKSFFVLTLFALIGVGKEPPWTHEGAHGDQKTDIRDNLTGGVGKSVTGIDLVPQIADCTHLLFEEEFSQGVIPEEWTALHGTQWSVVEGVLQGKPSTKQFQDKRMAAGNASHAGKTPSNRLLVPVDDCVMLFRFKLSGGLSGVHFGFNDGSVKTGTGHVCRFTVSTRKGQSLVKDKDVTLDGDKDEILVTDIFNVKSNTWYWMMLEIIDDEMVAQVSGGPILRARHPRFDIPKDQINLPTRGGGVVLYDCVRVWDAVRKK